MEGIEGVSRPSPISFRCLRTMLSFHTPLTETMSAPATEIATFYFGSDPPAGYLDGVNKFRDIIAKEDVEGYLGGAVGITHEEVEREGVKGKGAVLLIGWSSVETHMKFRESETFKNNIGLLREGVQKIEMVSVDDHDIVRRRHPLTCISSASCAIFELCGGPVRGKGYCVVEQENGERMIKRLMVSSSYGSINVRKL